MGKAPGFLDVNGWLKRLSDLGDQLEAYGRVVDFEAFRPELEMALVYTSGVHGGRPPFDRVMMLKVLVIQTANNLSDERTEFLINDRLSVHPLSAARPVGPGAGCAHNLALSGAADESGCDPALV